MAHTTDEERYDAGEAAAPSDDAGSVAVDTATIRFIRAARRRSASEPVGARNAADGEPRREERSA